MDRIQGLTIEEQCYINEMVLRHIKSPSVRAYSDDKFLDFVTTITEAYAKWIIGSSTSARLEIISNRI